MTDYNKEKQEIIKQSREGNDSVFFKGQRLLKNLEKLTKDLPIKPMKLEYHWFRFGFIFYLGLLDDRYQPMLGDAPLMEHADNNGKIREMKWVQITKDDGDYLKYYYDKNIRLPLCHNNEWFVPKITFEDVPPPSLSTPTDEYIDILIRGRDINKLRALQPYERHIKESGQYTYLAWKKLVD